MKEYTVKEVADLLGKHEETIKRWVRSGKLPNSYRNSDKEGWRIIESDLLSIHKSIPANKPGQDNNDVKLEADESELVKLAYQAVTLTSPPDEILSVLYVVGIKRTLEILLIMQQSTTKVKNPDGFIRKAIREGWTPTSTPIKLARRERRKGVYDLTQQEYEERFGREKSDTTSMVPFYNWLEE